MAELWMPEAIKKPGHPDKVGYDELGFGNKGPKRGTVVHSAEGWRTELLRLVKDINRRASWHFSVLTDGTIWQHYPIDAHCWHAGDTDDDGGVRANIELVGIEHEGVAGEPLTEYQVEMTVEITKFCADFFDRTSAYERYPVMPADGWTLVEHNEVSNVATACPSGRIPWEYVMEILNTQEDDVERALVWYNGYNYAERAGHHWHIPGDQVAKYLARGWPAVVSRKPEGSRLDF